MKVYLETMGCQMNKLDSELVISALRAGGHELVADRKGADAVLYNTCSVRRRAEQKVYSRLGADGQRKGNHDPKLIVGVLLDGPENWMDKALPIISMAGICFIIAIITSRSQEKLLTAVKIFGRVVIISLQG